MVFQHFSFGLPLETMKKNLSKFEQKLHYFPSNSGSYKKITFAFSTQETWIVPSISSLPLMVWNKPSFLPNHTEKLHSTPYNSGKIHMQKTNLFTLSQLPLREQNESIFCPPILSNFRNFGAIQLWKDLHTKDKPIYLITTAFH